jgi:hypothetical protein
VVVNDIAAVVLACAAVGWLVWRGFLTAPGSFGSWAMFSHIGACHVRLHDVRDGQPVCPWEYEAPQDFFTSPDALRSLVRYLDEEHGRKVAGDGVVLAPFTHIRIRVVNGRIVRA